MGYLNLVTDYDLGKVIKVHTIITPSNSTIKEKLRSLIIDTGADRTAVTKEFLKMNGYGKFTKSVASKTTATGTANFLMCEINGLTIANQFKFGKIRIDVLENWQANTVVGVIGMDILSQLTCILSHKHKKFLLTDQDIPDLAKLFV